VLLASLNPSAVAAGHDLADAVRIGGVSLSRSDLVGAATSVAERVGGGGRIAVLAPPTATKVLAIARRLISTPFGGPVVPEVYITIAMASGDGSA
jgi:fatty acid CoA ligase FadD36